MPIVYDLDTGGRRGTPPRGQASSGESASRESAPADLAAGGPWLWFHTKSGESTSAQNHSNKSSPAGWRSRPLVDPRSPSGGFVAAGHPEALRGRAVANACAGPTHPDTTPLFVRYCAPGDFVAEGRVGASGGRPAVVATARTLRSPAQKSGAASPWMPSVRAISP
jgi:hypothetical protein